MNVDADLENFEITFTAASGEPYKRYDEEKEEFYYERLVITDEAVDLNRLNNGASILKNHDPDHILGTITRAWIEDGKVVLPLIGDATKEQAIWLHQLWEERHEQRKLKEVLLRLTGAPVHIHHIAHGLEHIEGDAHGQSQGQKT